MQIFVSGSLAYDRIMDFPGKFTDHILPEKIHDLNVCFTVNDLSEKFGGTAGNIAYNLSLLGETPLILACVGKDFEQYRDWLTRNGLPLDGIRVVPHEFTASAYITTDLSDNQITGFNLGAMKHPSRFNFPENPEKALAILSPGNIDDMLAYSRIFKKRGIPYIFDPGQSIPIIPKDRLTEITTGADILISNDYELELIKKATGQEMENLLDRVRAAVITTLGEKGSVVLDKNRKVQIEVVPPREVIDPTGAGDAYRAGLMKGIVMGKDLMDAARMGSTCASYAVECSGTQEHRFEPAQFWKRHNRHFA